MELTSEDFGKLTVQQAADLLLDQGKKCAIATGTVDGVIYELRVALIPVEK